MNIVIKSPPGGSRPKFGEVQRHQFFVSQNGFLFQKVTESRAHMIANPNGIPCTSSVSDWTDEVPVKRILPEVERIEF